MGFLEEAEDYLKRSGECFVLGNFTEEVTLLGVGGQVLAGLTGVDLPFDVRDIIADIINLAGAEEWDWGLVVILLLDLCALLPVIGCLKYADEAAVLVKHADEAADLVKHADKLKYVDEAGELLTEGRKLADSGIKGLEDAVAEAQKLEKELAGSKLLDDMVGGGTDAIKSGINSYADFSKAVSDIGTRSDLTDAQKIKELQKLFENSNYKADINVPSDIQYVKGFDVKGNVIYDWPPKLGFDESTIKPMTRTDGLPDTWDRYGYMGGSNFADVPSTGKYTYSERAIPYVENEAAYHTGTFNNVTYFDKIDAIKNGDIDTFNALLHNEGISRWDLDDFEELCDSYDLFISKANKELGDSVDATYGIKGQAAEWGDMTGGAGQIVSPFGGDVLEKIGILKEN